MSGGLIGPSTKAKLTLMTNVLAPLNKKVLITFGLTAAASAVDAVIHKKLASGKAKLVKSSEEIKDMENGDSDLLIKGVILAIGNETKENRGKLLGMLSGIFGTSLLEDIIAD